MATANRKAIFRALKASCRAVGIRPTAYRGFTWQEVLEDIETFGGGIVVLWGCWSAADLAEVL